MPIRKYTADSAFDPHVIETMAAAFDDLRTILNIKNSDDPLGEVAAKKVVSLASQGITDRDEIARLVVADIEAG